MRLPVQEVPAYSASIPPEPVCIRAEVSWSKSICPETLKLVVVAFVVVALVITLVEAMSPMFAALVTKRPVVVEFTVAPLYVVGVKGKA